MLLLILSGPAAFPVLRVSIIDFTSSGVVSIVDSRLWLVILIWGTSLLASFRSDCVLKYAFSKLAFSLSSA